MNIDNVRQLGARTTIADQRSKTAIAAIRRKLEVLREWAANGVPIEVLPDGTRRRAWFPLSLRKFADWDGSQHSDDLKVQLGPIASCSRQTLTAHIELKGEVEDLLKKLASYASQSSEERVKTEDPHAALKVEQKRRKSVEAEYLRSRRDVKSLQAQLRRAKRIGEHEIRELRQMVREQTKKLRELTRAANKRTK